jgi:tetraacyldisaccharide 4'-kinase
LTAFQSQKLFIVSVGNLVVGGAGKTPFVALLSEALHKKKFHHCVVSRGYKKKLSGEYFVDEKNLKTFSPNDIGDEPYMLLQSRSSVSVVVGNKQKAVRLVEAKNTFTHVIVDDGFQTHSLKKNYDILLIDCSLPIEKYKLFPLGLLREPLSAMKRAQMIVFTKTNFCSLQQLEEKKNYFTQYINQTKQTVLFASLQTSLLVEKKRGLFSCDPSLVRGVNFVGFSGIANPGSFIKTQNNLGVRSIKNFVFKDHFNYSQKDINQILKYAENKGVSHLLTTKKDFYKINTFVPKKFSVFVIDIKHVLSKEVDLTQFFH